MDRLLFIFFYQPIVFGFVASLVAISFASFLVAGWLVLLDLANFLVSLVMPKNWRVKRKSELRARFMESRKRELQQEMTDYLDSAYEGRRISPELEIKVMSALKEAKEKHTDPLHCPGKTCGNMLSIDMRQTRAVLSCSTCNWTHTVNTSTADTRSVSS